ncbi:hypothetical protein [Aquicoccus sp.]|uniref:hypothetical protein n=1 Tax=Aquicoccus sp. TaxID=2055851 RepID=UPI003569C1F9
MTESKLKLVNLGLPKSGTTTLAHALEQAGWLCADHKVRRSIKQSGTLGGDHVGRVIYRGYFETGDPFHHLGFYDALTEISVLRKDLTFWPQCDHAVIQAMRHTHPDLRFVVTYRPPDKLSDSMRRWNNLGSVRLPNGVIPGLPHGFGGTDAERVRWIEGHYAMLRDIFGNDRRFLELPMDAPDARQRLAAHLGIDIPWWGRKNVNDTTPAERLG